jgi:hypothetical protein
MLLPLWNRQTPLSRVSSRSSTGGFAGGLLAIAPVAADFDLDTLLAAEYNRKTDTCGCFSFQNCTIHVGRPSPPVKKNIASLFGEKIGVTV